MSLRTGQVDNIKFPWFKERLKTKYLRDLKQKQQLSGALDSSKWRFLSPGLDDFRDGYPTVHKELLIQCKSGPSPVLFGMPSHAGSVKFPHKRLSKNQVCYSKQNPQSQAQREFIDAVEHKLKQHPLALYPHLESGMTPELFEQVLSVLDPDMCIKEELPITSPTKKMENLEESRAQSDISTLDITKPSTSIKSPKEKQRSARPKNPYKWPGLNEILDDKGDETASAKHLLSTSQEDHDPIKLFCEWISSLGGESSDLTESTILDMFMSDYEKKLPNDKTYPNETTAKCYSFTEEHQKDHGITELAQAYKCNDVPKALADIKGSQASEEQLSEQDKELKQIHGFQTFREFIIKKGARMPRFLSAVFSEEEKTNKIRGSTSSSSKGTVVH